ncbi:MAG: hypothetical protein AW09_003314 [Candidatus Accumulibacter phosphatis]|uniref:Uncharacterized protein n=1 Tax=Candidatus Accumulibacter phosphatis TaxID=327160 RepID=A0A080LSY5_9PROT|nr:MAG: hypothetical protein AW09_003314 [Candidatus Accumulibacter phosphatis]
MAADFGLIVDAAERCAHELSSQRSGDRLAKRGLANSGRADKAQNGSVPARVELAHREKLDDTLLDLVEAEMIGVEDLTGFGNLDPIRLGCPPWQLDQPVEIGTHHRVLRRSVRHARQALQLLVCLACHLLGHLGFGDGFAQRLDLDAVAGFPFPEFLLDRLQLLAQQVFALTLIDVRLGTLVEFA